SGASGPWRDYVTLTKPRIMSLLLLTGAAGFFVGAGRFSSLGAFGLTMLGLALACGGASALNHYLDRDIDQLMGSRTEPRPGASGHFGWAAMFMFAIVFIWTPPHFWALALMIKEHYARAGVPMLPVTRGDRETARQILWYTVVLVAVTLVPVAVGTFGVLYGVCAALLGAVFLWLAVSLRRPMERAA